MFKARLCVSEEIRYAVREFKGAVVSKIVVEGIVYDVEL